MNFLSAAIIGFIILEILNVTMLYFVPGTKQGNGLGVFNAFEKSKADPEIYDFIKYLINWVAGTKLIFLSLLVVILIFGNDATKLYSVGALCVSIFSYYFGLYPTIKKLDKAGHISPKGYSKTLSYMITGFLVVFSIVIIIVSFTS